MGPRIKAAKEAAPNALSKRVRWHMDLEARRKRMKNEIYHDPSFRVRGYHGFVQNYTMSLMTT
jgi:hypothetical protein